MFARAIFTALTILFPLQGFAQNASPNDVAELRNEVKSLRELVEKKGVVIRLIDTSGWTTADNVAGTSWFLLASGGVLQAFGTTAAARTTGGYLFLTGVGGFTISTFIEVLWPTPAKSDGIAEYFLTNEGMNVFLHLNEDQMLAYAEMDSRLAMAVRKINKADKATVEGAEATSP